MDALLTDPPTLEADALNWAKAYVPVDAVQQIRHTDWARTFRLDGAAATAYLKIVPGNRAQQLGHMPDIAARFPSYVPRVLAVDPNRGWLLTAKHDGSDLDDDEPESQLSALVDGLARIQTLAMRDSEFLAGLERFDPAQMPGQLLHFLELDARAKDSATPPLGAAQFIGVADAKRYLRLLQPRLQLLSDHISGSQGLPATLIHGDLHTGNAAVRDDGGCILLDWDECAAGPAGCCLHGLFDGSTMPAILLSRWANTGAPVDTPEGRLLATYVERLADGGYASVDELIHGLAGAICAGQIRFILTYGQFPHSPSARRTAPSIRHLLDNLLDLCDWLCAKDHSAAMVSADDYASLHEWDRAQRMLQDQVAKYPQRADLLARFGELSRKAGDHETAVEAGLESVKLEPDEARWRIELAQTYLEQVDLSACHEALQAALQLDSGCVGGAQLLLRLEEFRTSIAEAAKPDGWPRVQVSAAERDQGRLNADTMALLQQLFRRHGVVQIDEVFDPGFVESLHQTFLQRYQRQLDERAQQNHLQVGDKRYMLTLEMDDVFGSADFIASGMLLPVMKEILGQNCILGAYTAVISLPGSEDQQLHKDHTPLFEEQGWGLELPCFAAQIILPLVRMDEKTGTTRCFKDTQSIPYADAVDRPTYDPIVPQGSCLLIDYATVHQGLANRSSKVRPIVALAYSRPWFRDVWNYHLQPPMRFTSQFFDSAPQVVRKLISWREIERLTVRQEEHVTSTAISDVEIGNS